MKKKLLISVAICVIVGGSLLLAVTLAGPRPEMNSAPEPARQSGRTIPGHTLGAFATGRTGLTTALT